MLLSKDDILRQAQQFRYMDIVDPPGVTGTVRLRVLSAAARNAFLATVLEMDGGKVKNIKIELMQTALLSYAWVDETGKPLFSRDEIGTMGADLVQHLFEQAQELNGLSEEAVATAAENFPATLSVNSISD